jgi:uncharacterized protein YceK
MRKLMVLVMAGLVFSGCCGNVCSMSKEKAAAKANSSSAGMEEQTGANPTQKTE